MGSPLYLQSLCVVSPDPVSFQPRGEQQQWWSPQRIGKESSSVKRSEKVPSYCTDAYQLISALSLQLISHWSHRYVATETALSTSKENQGASEQQSLHHDQIQCSFTDKRLRVRTKKQVHYHLSLLSKGSQKHENQTVRFYFWSLERFELLSCKSGLCPGGSTELAILSLTACVYVGWMHQY